MSGLHIGHDGRGRRFVLPDESVTQTFGVLAKRGVGKTYTASVLAEELVGAGHQVVVLDPLDAWWGLRSSADGNAPGLPVYVFGDEHGDLPLDAATGALIADVVVERAASVVLSLRHLSKAAQRRFVADFAERLYHRKGEAQYRTPLHLVIDEADAFAPQRVMADTARMLGAIDDCVRRGRSSGIGVTLITQRAASLNKDVLTQCEVLVALRTIAPQDRKAIDEWIAAHDSEGRREEFMASLASLGVGEAWVWSPGWLDVFERIRVRARRTFDSSSTPKAGAKAQPPQARAVVDLDALRERMASVVAQAEANDPKKLRAKIMQLERELAAAREAPPAPADHDAKVARLELLIDEKERELAQLQRVRESVTALTARLRALHEVITTELEPRIHDLGPLSWPHETLELDGTLKADGVFASVPARTVRPAVRRVAQERAAGARAAGARATRATPPAAAPAARPATADLNGPERRILDALAWWEAIGVAAPTKGNVGFIAGYRVGKKVGGNFGVTIGALRTRGFIDYPSSRTMALTDEGRRLATPPDIAPTVEALHAAIFARLQPAEQRVLQPLIDAYPSALTKQEAGALAGYTVGPKVGGNFGVIMGRLRTLGLIDYPTTATVVATDLLFPEGLS